MNRSYLKISLLAALFIVFLLAVTSYFQKTQQKRLNDDLFDAVLAGDINKVDALLRQGADGNAVSSGSTGFAARGVTALIEAAGQGHDDIIKLLLNNGANIESKTTMGITPLIIAAMKGHASTVQLLLSKGANPVVKHSLGRTALDEALHYQKFYQKRPALRPSYSDFSETVRLLRQTKSKG